jgi:hypothetical protein
MNENTQFINLVLEKIDSTNDTKKKNKLLEMIGQFYKDDFEKEYNKYKFSIKNKKLNEKYSPSLVNNLTEFGVSKIISKCKEINTESSYKLLLSLFTGRSIQFLNSKEDFVFRTRETNLLFFKYTFFLKELNQNKKLESHLYKNLKEIKLELPSFFGEFSTRDKLIPSSDEEVEKILKSINIENTLRINLNQVKQYLNYMMVNKQVDSTIISIINGQFEKKIQGFIIHR